VWKRTDALNLPHYLLPDKHFQLLFAQAIFILVEVKKTPQELDRRWVRLRDHGTAPDMGDGEPPQL